MNKTLGEYYEKYRHSMYTVTTAILSNAENVDVPAIMYRNQKLHFSLDGKLL